MAETREYQGLIIAYCPKCGSYTTFFSKEPAKHFFCRNCKEQIPLNGVPTPLISTCECGNRIRGVTNSEEDKFQFNCRCGYPNSVGYSERKNTYYGMR